MIATIKHKNRKYSIRLDAPLDISIPIQNGSDNVGAWYLGPPRISAHREDGFVGSVKEGASVNFNDIWFNPHSHGTHTESVGHITENFHSVNQHLDRYFFLAELITIAPEKWGDDFVISKKQLQYALGQKKRQAVVIRTLPNLSDKKSRQYSHTNPPYLLEEAAKWLCTQQVEHLLVDLPSVDKENDVGALLAHHAFWDVHGSMRMGATITEFIYVPNAVVDGTYFLNMQVAPFENDASPSRPVLYKIMEK
ncbi:MAG: cyclase family protein [Flavobacteriaceae bacterium]